jgi:3-deoxy-D-manno-octulosonic-acid transferase
MISAIFKKEQPFFQWYGGLYRKMLKNFTHLFVQEEASRILLQKLQIHYVSVSGDTRFDRVAEISEKFQPDQGIQKFCGNSKILVAGSTWHPDEELIKKVMQHFPDVKLIIAPHEIHQQRLNELKQLFPHSIFFSELESSNNSNQFLSTKPETANFLIIDNIGMLSKLYSYATITYVGGGFNHGIHNLLEAVVFGKPVIFGPKFEKFQEALDLKKLKAGFSINNKEEMKKQMHLLLTDLEVYDTSCTSAKTYIQDHKGATEKILLFIQEKRLLTN